MPRQRKPKPKVEPAEGQAPANDESIFQSWSRSQIEQLNLLTQVDVTMHTTLVVMACANAGKALVMEAPFNFTEDDANAFAKRMIEKAVALYGELANANG